MPPSATPRPVETDSETAKLAVWKQALYDRVREEYREKDLFTQEDLGELNVIPNSDKMLLLRVVQALSNDNLLITFREASGEIFWKWRDAQEAHKYKQCATDEQRMVYAMIDDAGGDGMWSQTLQRRLNMHDAVFKNTVKQLQGKNLIAPFKSVEHPNKKMYIKASIQPSDRATGGPWYTDQNLDEAFIEDLQRVVFDYVKKQSGYLSRHGQESRAQQPKKGTKRGAKEMEAPASQPARAPSKATQRAAVFLPLPAGYTGYPTVREIARFLTTSGITNNTILSEEDVTKLVNVLVWDNLLEPVRVGGKMGYRVSRIAKQSTENSAGRDDLSGAGPQLYVSPYTEAPCGKCPVFELCEEGGPVGPSNCEYFTRWLGLDLPS